MAASGGRGRVLACPPTTKVSSHGGVAEGCTGGCWQAQGAQGTSLPLFVWYEKFLGFGKGNEGFFLGVISQGVSSYPQRRGTWQIAPWLDIRTNTFSPTGVCGEGHDRWLAGGRPPSGTRWSALTTSLSPRLTSTEKDSPRRSQRGRETWGEGGGLAQEQSCPQAAGQRVPGGRRRRSGGARRVREVWAAVRPQLPPGPAAEPIATTRRRRQLPLPTPSPARR